ncbi:MAG TPA: PP2C family protein-serine/threonine phosphatase [Streptosporangiaceae bacterium]|nr:PP2C family protein-serine/threonine phosphatase [Streptosporangiaceae bacterium]
MAVLALGLVITAALVWVTAHDYNRSEHRLLSLETQLTADAIVAADPLYVEDHLGGAVNLAAATDGDVAVFRKAMSGSVGANGSFAAASLWHVTAGAPRLVTTVGSGSLLAASQAAVLIRRAETSTTFLVTELTGPHALQIAYAEAASGPGGSFVAFAEQSLPVSRRISVPSNSPLSQLNLAVYLGRSQSAAALLETDSTVPLPLRGTTSTSTIPFGNTMLTIATSPRSALSGPIPQVLPWAIAAGGVLLTLLAVLATERLIRRRDEAARLSEQATNLYMEQRTVAETLQHALLPQVIPAIPGLEIAVRYRSAAERADIGGDWYDVVPLDEDSFVFVIGDVSGHDLRAATVMASLHYACRAYALEGHPPAVILSRLRRMLDVTRDGHVATVLCGLAEVKAHRVTLANAGHLPPLVAGDTDAGYPPVKPGPPIGIPQHGAPEPAVITIPARGLLLAYTDGLIERRDETLDAGMKRLADAVAGTSLSLDDLLDSTIAGLPGDEPFDDVALIGLRWLT